MLKPEDLQSASESLTTWFDNLKIGIGDGMSVLIYTIGIVTAGEAKNDEDLVVKLRSIKRNLDLVAYNAYNQKRLLNAEIQRANTQGQTGQTFGSPLSDEPGQGSIGKRKK